MQGITRIYNFYYLTPKIGSETTVKFYFSPSQESAATLFASAKPTAQSFYNNLVSQNSAYQAVLGEFVEPNKYRYRNRGWFHGR